MSRQRMSEMGHEPKSHDPSHTSALPHLADSHDGQSRIGDLPAKVGSGKRPHCDTAGNVPVPMAV